MNSLSLSMQIETERLVIKDISSSEAAFYLKLFNDPDWIRNISDKGLKTVEEVEEYIENKVLKEFQVNGNGFFTIRTKDHMKPIGVSTLLFRDNTSFYDVGYGLMPDARGKGYAKEATLAMMAYAENTFGIPKIYAITKLDNEPSIGLLQSLGFSLKEQSTIFGEELNNIFEYQY
ncbi:GNAT family N-acetyltransferase [Winogradskyella sp. 3972H.M.0a.05]|uniref:GNAT family N-acetyltransferase n=1 Tax=Winogradskyella sp. 3972H.M.0a.05 TaxID=2950277 RepID=UPI003394C249